MTRGFFYTMWGGVGAVFLIVGLMGDNLVVAALGAFTAYVMLITCRLEMDR